MHLSRRRLLAGTAALLGTAKAAKARPIHGRKGGSSGTPPVITSNGGGATATISITTTQTAVTTVTASGTTPITYSKSGTDAALFSINSSTGVLALLTTQSAASYHVTVTATNAAGHDDQAITLIVAASAFNGGKSQVNFNFLQVGGDYPFLNCLKTAQFWGLQDNSGPPDPDTLDSNGYPIVISNGGVYTVFFITSQAERPGNWAILWDGNGTVNIGMSATFVSASAGVNVSGFNNSIYQSTLGSGRVELANPATGVVLGIKTTGVSNLRFVHVDDETALLAGQVFGIKFKQRLVEANFGVLRFLNWQAGNTTNITTWATRKPVTYAMYAGVEFRGSIYAGLTTNIGAAYSATLAGFTLVDKAMVSIKFNASNNSACTLNMNGTGAINILSEYSGPLVDFAYPIGGTYQSIAVLVYDATLNAWIKQGGDALGSAGIDSGVPPELMVQLCAEVGAHPHFVCPPLAIDPATDFIPSLAAYCRDSGPAWMIPRFEGPNELWNTGAGFYQTGYANAKSNAYHAADPTNWPFTNDYSNWYGKIMSVLGQAVSTVYSANRSRYQVLCGVQTFGGASDTRLSSAAYVAQSAAPQSPYTKSAASSWVTTVTLANYYTPSDYGTPAEATLAAAYAGGDLTAPGTYAATSNSGGGSFNISNLAAVYATWKTWAQGFGIQKMCGYEGGYSPDYGGDTQLNNLRAASKLYSGLNAITTLNYNNFTGLTGGGFTAEFPSCFQLSGFTPSNNAWSVLEDIYQSPNPPQWTAIVAFNVP